MLLLQAWSVSGWPSRRRTTKHGKAEVHAAATWIDSNTSPSAVGLRVGQPPRAVPPLRPTADAALPVRVPADDPGLLVPGATDRVVESWSQDGPDVIVEAPGTVPLSLPAVPPWMTRARTTFSISFRAFVKGHYRLALDQADLRILAAYRPNGPP